MNKILSQVHPYSIFYSDSDNRWHTTIADPTKVSGRKPVARKKKCDLERFLFEHYHLQLNTETKSQKTFAEIFVLVQERKLQFIKNPEKLLSAQNTQIKNDYDYRRYFSDTDFEHTPIDEITKKDVEDICLLNLQRYDLKKKSFASLRGILKSVFDMAYSEYWITDNVYQRMDFRIFKNMIVPDTPIDERVHTRKEVSAILKELHRKQADNPKLSSAWALELQIIMGLRRGEVPPLEWSDITETGVITNRAVYFVYQGICNNLGITISRDSVKGPHSFRRNAITYVVNETNGNIIMASELFGNSPEVAKQNYFTGTDLSVATQILNKRCLLE